MKKILQVPAVAATILLAGSLFACANPGARPDVNPTPTVSSKSPAPKAGLAQPRNLPKNKAPKAKKVPDRPVDVESVEWDGTFSNDAEIQEFRIVVDEVWNYCIVNAKGGMHCFPSTDAP